MKKLFAKASALSLLAGSIASSHAAVNVLTFEGLLNLESVGNYYNGGFGGSGSGPGPNYGITFNTATLALIDADAGGSGNVGGEPSPDTVMFFLEQVAIMDVPAGFQDGFSFFYSMPYEGLYGNAFVYDGPGGTGTLLGSFALAQTPNTGAPDPSGNFSPLVPIGVAFEGTAYSVVFDGIPNYIVFDDVTFGSETPGDDGVVPEPSSILGGLALGALVLRRTLRRK